MSGFQRMIAIPQEEYIQLKSVQHAKQPEAQRMTALTELHQQQSQIKDPYEKLMLQGDSLDDMKALKEKMRQDVSLGTPKPYRNRALSLYRSLEPHVKFNERGELYGDDNKVIDYSRAEDLIQHAVRDRRRDFTPLGWDYFLKVLKKHNIPKSTLNRATLDELAGKGRNVKRRSTHVTPFFFKGKLGDTTPPSKKRRRSDRMQTPSLRYPAKDFLKKF